MRYSVSGRAPSFISAALAVLLALAMHLSAGQTRADERNAPIRVASTAAEVRPNGA
jgi:hypothetical protein